MNVSQIKEKFTCLDYLGDRVVRKTSYGYIAKCPWREDRHPSLTVTLNGKGWQDHATGEHGNLINLVMKCLGTRDLGRVCGEFNDIQPKSFSFDQSKEEESGFHLFSLVPLQSRGLYAYLHERGVSIDIARQFLQEAHYSFREGDGYLYALAYPNDKGGYELRSSRFKGGTRPKGITTHINNKTSSVVVFEGFFDMLSFATLCGGVKHNYIVLNSIVNKEDALDVLRALRNQIYLCLDNDRGGDEATAFLLNALPEAKDIRQRFVPWKDVNDYLLNQYKEESNYHPNTCEETQTQSQDYEEEQSIRHGMRR